MPDDEKPRYIYDPSVIRFVHGWNDDTFARRRQYHYPNHDKKYPPAETQTLAEIWEAIKKEEGMSGDADNNRTR